MTDTRHSIEDQHGSPGADAPGDGAPRPGKGETLAREAPEQAGAGEGRSQAGAADGHAEPAPGVPADGDLAELEGDLDELVKTAAQRDEYLSLAQRTQADFENYRKRVARESAGAQSRGVASLAKELLPALDNLDRALEAADQADPLLEGVRLVRSELSDALARVGVESFSPVGEPFDPSLHEAVASTPQPAGGPASGTVVEVYQPGYRLGTSVIRPARVVVAA
jgi:molecular chaperone GrpE